MNSISISQLKINPSFAINQAVDYPVAVENRSEIKAYLIGKELYEKLIFYLENQSDKFVIGKTDFSKGKDFEKVAKQLGI